MKFVLLLVFLTVGFASSRIIELVESIVEESVDTIPGESLDNESEAMTVETEKRRHFDSAEVLPYDTTSARADKCWRADGPYRWKANCDFRGHKIATVKTKHLADCQNACKEHEECTHFTYNFARDICSLQKSETRLTEISSENGICGFVVEDADSHAKFVDHACGHKCWKTDEDGVARWGVNCKFHGTHLNIYSTNSLTECRLACKINEQCTHFNYDYVNNKCYLIQTTSKPLKESHQDNYFCGLIYNRFVPPVTTTTAKPIPKCWNTENPPLTTRVIYWGEKCNFNGRDYRNYKTSIFSDCRMSCGNDQKCTHFTFDVSTNKCYLKQTTAPFTPTTPATANSSGDWSKYCFCGFVADPNALIPDCS